MSTALNVQLALPEIDPSLPDSELAHFAPIQIELEALAKIDELHLRRAIAWGTPYPLLYLSGVVYREERPGREDWPDVPTVLRNGWGDCEDLAAWRCAELRVMGIRCEPVIKWRHIPRAIMLSKGYPSHTVPAGGVWLVHCLVKFPDGSIEDPSKILGMGGQYLSRV